MKKIVLLLNAIVCLLAYNMGFAQTIGNGTPLLFAYPPQTNPNGLGPHNGVPAPSEGPGYLGSWALWDGPAQGQTIVASASGAVVNVQAQVAIRTSTGDIQCKIYDAPNGNLLATSTNTVNAPWFGNEFNFVMGDWSFSGFSLVSGTPYYVEFTATNGNQFFIGMANGSAYAPGQHYTGPQGGVNPTGYDIDMILHYGAAVPAEPISTLDQADIDADGDMDFVRTTFTSTDGGIDFFINDGNNNFTVTELNPFGIASHPLPIGLAHLCSDLADLDGDGDLDLTVVAWGGGGFYYFENEGTPTSPFFGIYEYNPFALEIGSISSIDIVDLDGDGLLDVIGSNDLAGSYQLAYYHNIGTPTIPEFDVPVMNPFGLDFDASMGYFDYPDYITFTDWDDDGDLDMLSMPGTAVYYNENVGTATNPIFNPKEYQFSYSAYFGSIEPVNWDSDPEKEMLLSVESGDILLFDTPHVAITLQPSSVSVCETGYATFQIQGNYINSYEWQFLDPNFGWIPALEDWDHYGTYSSTYVSSYTYLANAGSYRCVVSDVSGNVLISDTVILTVNPIVTYYADNDGDGFGDFYQSTSSCTGPPTGYVTNASDCDDTNASVFGPTGDPTVFGIDSWNMYGFLGTNFGAYRGYYTRTGMSYDSQLDYGVWDSPSFTPDWVGCSVSSDNHSWVAKRHGFPASTNPYRIRLTGWDDDVYVYVNGNLVYSTGCCGGTVNAWTGTLDANSDVEIRYVEYGGLAFIGFEIVEVVPLTLYTSNPDISVEACSQFSVSPNFDSAFGFSGSDLTFTATVDNASIVQPTVVNVDTWWGLNVYFNGGGSVGTTVLHLTATDPNGNSATVDYNVTTTPCNPLFGDLQSYLSCGETTGTVSIFVWNYPDAIPYTVQSLFSSNQNAITDADLTIIATNPSSHLNSAGLQFQGTEFVIQYTYTQWDNYSQIFLDLTDTAGTFYEHAAYTSRTIDYSAPTIQSDFSQIVLDADANCTAVAQWSVSSFLPQNFFGTGSQFISNFTGAGIFYVAANAGPGVTSFGITGNAGADGSGEVYQGSETYVAPSGRAYTLFWETAQEYYNDPGINTIVLVDASETSAVLTYDPFESDARAVVEGLSGTETVLFAATIGSNPKSLNGGNSTFYSQADMLLIGERMADAIDATRTTATGNPFDLTAIDAAMQTETSYLVSNVLTNFYTLDPATNVDYYYTSGIPYGIGDGGYDMYDGGNYIVTNYNNSYDFGGSGIPYTNGSVEPGGPSIGGVNSNIALYDDCAFTYSFDYASGSAFPLGTTSVTCTAVDGSGNTSQFIFDVIVNGSSLDYYVDADNDGHGAGAAIPFCQPPTSGYSLMPDDCDDGDPTRYAGATEVCNGIDDDCDTFIDNGLAFTNYYVDADNDTYGAGPAFSFCQAPASGYSLMPDDCDDGNTAIHPGATELCNNIDDDCNGAIDNGLTFLNYYVDTDNDTFGAGAAVSLCANPGAGYSMNNTDCNNNVASIHPGAAEICGNNIDDNCNSQIDEGCTVIVPGDNPSTALSIPVAYWPNCSSINSTLVGATPSQSAQTICISGEDRWYQFVATTEAASIVVSTLMNDVVIELQTASGTLIAQENAVSGLGTEILNVSGLTAGQLYKLGVRNYNSSLGIGAFTACVRMLKRGNCDSGFGSWSNNLSLCQVYKATWAGSGASYRYTFTGIAGAASGNVYTKTQSGPTADQLILSTVTPTLPYGSTYHVLVTNIFTLLDGAGNAETVEVAALSPCTLFTIAEPITSLRASDQCAVGPKFRGAVVYSLPWICGVSNWRWRFTEVNPVTYQLVGIPIEVNRNAAANAIQLSTVSQLQNGKTYAVQTAPLFSYTGTNYNWGPVSYMCIVGSAGVIENPGEQPNQRLVETDQPNLLVYPNPTDGNFILNISGISTSHAEIRVHDALGRQLYNNRVAVEGQYTANVNLSHLSNGLYMVEVVYNGKTLTQRMMIEK